MDIENPKPVHEAVQDLDDNHAGKAVLHAPPDMGFQNDVMNGHYFVPKSLKVLKFMSRNSR